MRKISMLAAIAAVSITSPAFAVVINFDPPPSITLTTVVEGTNQPNQTNVATFTSIGGTTLNFAGYNASLSNISLILNGSSTNLFSASGLGSGLAFGSTSNVGSDGSLNFTGTGYFDSFFTALGAGNYTLGYTLTGNGGPNGLRITATNVTNVATGAVPEPATWAMMLLGFGGIGFAMRRKQVPALSQIA